MARRLSKAFFIGICLLTGCVSVKNGNGLVPPSALCSKLKCTVGVPKEPVPVAGLKSFRTDASVHVQEWIFSGASAGMLDMSIQAAIDKSGFRKVYYTDYEQISYLGFVTMFNLVVYGE